MPNTLSCYDCTFFEDHVANQGTSVGDAGLCRFNPPVTQPEPNARGFWPGRYFRRLVWPFR